MFGFIRFRHMAIVGVLCCVVFPGSKGSAQLYCSPDWTPEYKCLEHCGPCAGTSSGGASGGNYGGAIGEIVGLPGDIIRAHNKAKAAKEAKKLTELNDQGITAYDKKDWAAAEADFKQAVKLNPNDHINLRNLALTQGNEGEDAYRKGDYTTALNYFQQALANDPAEDPDKRTLNSDLVATQERIASIRHDQERREQDKIAASKMKQSIQNLAQSLTAAPSSNTAPSSSGLDFNDGKSGNNTNKPSELTFMDSEHQLKDALSDSKPATSSTQPNQGASTCTFNTTCGPVHPDLGGSAPASSTANSGTGALNQARVAAGQGNLANHTISDPDASEAARHPFDTPGGVAASMPVVAGSPASAPVPIKIQNMPAYQEKAAEKEKLQSRMKELDTRLTEIRAEQAKSQTPNQALAMEAADLKQAMSVIPGQIVVKQMEIDKFVVSMEEESTPAKGKDKTPPKATVPVPPPGH